MECSWRDGGFQEEEGLALSDAVRKGMDMKVEQLNKINI